VAWAGAVDSLADSAQLAEGEKVENTDELTKGIDWTHLKKRHSSRKEKIPRARGETHRRWHGRNGSWLSAAK
jgi:hypothetical protein